MKARPTIYQGIQMRSRLEARWAYCFDQCGWEWTYETNNFGHKATPEQYLPDFRVVNNGRVTYIEIKPPLDDRQLQVAQRKMEIIWASEPNASLWILQGVPGQCRMDCIDAVPDDADLNDPVLYQALGCWRTYETDPSKWDSVA